MHILLLEPNTVLAAVYTKAFIHAGHSVVHVTNAQAGIDAADTHRPDVIVLELQLPAHSGIEFLHEFRSYAEWQQVPVVVLTLAAPARLAPVKAAFGRDLGVHTMLYKPQTSLADLLRAVREAAEAA